MPKEMTFKVCTSWPGESPYCAYFSGSPEEKIVLSERITLALIPMGSAALEDASEYVLTAMGTSGMDKTIFGKGPEIMGMPFAAVTFRGKLYVETHDFFVKMSIDTKRYSE